MPEQRRHPRRPVAVRFSCRDEAASGQLSFDSGDISVGGAFLKSEVLLEQGDELSLEFDLPPGGRAVRARASVAWVRRFPKPGEDAGMGVKFLDLSEADRFAMQTWLGAS